MRWWKHGDPSIVLQHHRKHTLNREYFDDITTPEQAYWLGFFTADGCVVRHAKGYSVRLALKSSDSDHVQLFCDALGSSKFLYYTPKGTVEVQIDSKYMVESLERLGVTPRKSLTAEPWRGPEDLMPHYWRGLYDGDGTIFPNSRHQGEWTIGICGSRPCVEAFSEWARLICGSKAKAYISNKRSPDCWSWRTAGGFMPQRLAAALYADATVALARKKILAEILLETDFNQIQTEGLKKRGESMRNAWATGRHAGNLYRRTGGGDAL
jgi:hypothetical protein